MNFEEGTDIHIGPGQEQHLPHEAWHVVQPRRVRPRPINMGDQHLPHAGGEKHLPHDDGEGVIPFDQEQHLPHEAWHVVQERKRTNSGDQHLPHEAWHVVQMKKDGEAWHAQGPGEAWHVAQKSDEEAWHLVKKEPWKGSIDKHLP